MQWYRGNNETEPESLVARAKINARFELELFHNENHYCAWNLYIIIDRAKCYKRLEANNVTDLLASIPPEIKAMINRELLAVERFGIYKPSAALVPPVINIS